MAVGARDRLSPGVSLRGIAARAGPDLVEPAQRLLGQSDLRASEILGQLVCGTRAEIVDVTAGWCSSQASAMSAGVPGRGARRIGEHHPSHGQKNAPCRKGAGRPGRDLTRVLVIVHAPDVRDSDCLRGVTAIDPSR